MRIVSLNVNHRTRPSPIPEALATALCDLSPDVIVLTEYVTGPDHARFEMQLRDYGLPHLVTSKLVEYKPNAWQNQIAIASRHPIRETEARTDAPEPQANTNILTVDVKGIRLVGLRAPSYKGQQWLDYWAWLADVTRGDVAIGDFNVDPARDKARDRVLAPFLQAFDWQLLKPEGDWSYQGPTGRTSCIDHCALASGRRAKQAFYAHEPFVGNLSDHAALVVDLDESASI